MARTAKRKGGNQPPISAHPAFPAIVALWFAALFGIGSLVLPNALIEQISVALGLPSLLAAAAPPIGFTAKLAIAGVAATLGVLAGLLIARKVVASQAGSPRRQTSQDDSDLSKAPAKRPIVATEELGEEGLGPVVEEDDYEHVVEDETLVGKPVVPGRRRALSVTDDSGPSDYLSSVPLPGEADPYSTSPVTQESLPTAEAETLDTLDLSTVAEDDAQAEADHAELMQALHDSQSAEEQPPRAFDAPKADGRPFDAPLSAASQGDASLAESVAEDTEPPRPHFGLQLGVPLETSSEPAQSFDQSRPEAPRQVFGEQPDEAKPIASVASANEPPAFAAPAASAPQHFGQGVDEPAHQESGAPLADLSMSDLIERFARSMQEANATADNSAGSPTLDELSSHASETGSGLAFEADPLPFQRSDDADDEGDLTAPFAMPAFSAPVEEAEPATPAPFAAPAAAEEPATARPFAGPGEGREEAGVPAALRPLDLGAFDDEDEDDDPFANDYSFSLSSNGDTQLFGRPIEESAAPFEAAATAPESNQPAEDEDGDTGNDEAYSSLLSMKSPLGEHREFVRIEDEEDVSDASDAPEPVVVFPGQGESQPRVSNQPRPFDAPPDAVSKGLARATPTTPAQSPTDPAETERALRDALEKLQRMSGAA